MKQYVKRALSVVTMAVMLISSSAILKADAETISTTYVKYVRSSNTTSQYSLTISENTTIVQSRVVIDEDTRQRDGHDGIVKLVDGNSSWMGTGFIVGDHVIATAAHCVYIEDRYENTHHFAENLQVQMYNENGTLSGVSYTVSEIHVPKVHIDQATYVVDNDYALLYVEEDLSNYTQFALGVPYNINTDAFEDIPLYVTGVQSNVLYTGAGNASSATSRVITYDCDTAGGQSGSPVYTAVRYTVGTNEYIVYTAIAIHCAGYNTGSLVDSNVLAFYRGNTNIGS